MTPRPPQHPPHQMLGIIVETGAAGSGYTDRACMLALYPPTLHGQLEAHRQELARVPIMPPPGELLKLGDRYTVVAWKEQ